MRALFLLALLLAGCGVDGPPVRPEPEAEPLEPGLHVSGRVEIGVTGGHVSLR